MNLKATTVFQKNWEALNSDTRYIENRGGSRSSKTYSLSQCLILYCIQNKDVSVSIIRKTFPALRATVMRDFFKVLDDLNLYDPKKHSKSQHIYKFPNGSFVEFFSADDAQKLRGRSRDLAFLNEANELYYEDFKQIVMRTTDKVIVDYNPSESYSYLYDLPKEKTTYIHSTYKDNPFLTKEIIEEIEFLKKTDEEMYKIYALGERCQSKENVYKEWDVLKERPVYFENFIYGIDFGYTHPTSLVKIWYSIERKELFFEEIIYESYLTSTDIIDRMKSLNIEKDVVITADYARPEIIKEMRQAGYNVVNAIKDVKDGINNVKTFICKISENSPNIIKENQNYKYKKVNGKATDEVVKNYDDAMDAIRYGVFYIKKYLNFEDGNDDIGIYTFDF